MTHKSKEQLDYDVALNRLKIAQEAFGEAKAALIKAGCEHPESHRSSWSHSFSNGFGKWRTDKLPYYTVCNQVQRWGAWGPIPVNNYDD